jgi:hypothetical protein
MRFRLWAGSLLSLILFDTAWAQCALDGTPPGTATTYSPVVQTRTISITTSHPNDIIILHAGFNAETNSSFSFPSIVSVTGGGLTFTRRFQHQDTVVSCYASGPCFSDVEEWSAPAANPVSATLTVTVNMDLGYASLLIWGVNGTSGFDANGALPALSKDLSNASTNIFIASVSTSSAPDMLFAYADVFAPVTGAFFPPAAPLTSINSASQDNIFNGFGLSSASAYEPLSHTVSGITVSWDPGHTYHNWIGVVDALVCTSGGNAVNVDVNE